MKQWLALLLALTLAPLAWSADPPGRAGRLSYFEGEASVFADPAQGWEPARINTPLTGENSVWTEPGSRAEVWIGATALWLGEVTQLDILRLDDEAFGAHLPRGALAIHLRGLGGRQSYAISTPLARFQLVANGRYRVESDPDRNESLLTVLTGSARVAVSGGEVNVDPGRAIRVTGGARPLFAFENAAPSALEDWAVARDESYENRVASRYVPPEMTGWQDLDEYGTWQVEPDYGALWFPTHVAAGWAPYRYGRWVWVRPWGWTWVDDAPWGYAPFHYGRWVVIGGRWGWYPGPRTVRPVWAPALVGWIGGAGWSVTLSTGPSSVVGWYPLSPYDAYRPWYGANATYVTNINRVVRPPRYEPHGDRHEGRRPDGYREGHPDNRDRGATVVARDHFGTHRPVQNFIAPIGGEVVRAQPIVAGSTVLPPRPDRDRQARPARPGGAPAERGQPAAMPSAPVTPASRAVPPESATRAKPTTPVPASRPVQATPMPKPYESTPAADRGHRPGERSQPAPAVAPKPAVVAPPVVTPKPAVAAPPAVTPKPAVSAPPATTHKPAPASGGSQPAKPAPSQEKPGKGHEGGSHGGEKPARAPDTGSSG